jgi:hypothetical protein
VAIATAISEGQVDFAKAANATVGLVGIVKENVMDRAGFAIEGRGRGPQELWGNVHDNRWKGVLVQGHGQAV